MTDTLITREEIVEQARTWLGTRWAHQARKKGVGVDCVGLFACVLAELGAPVADFVSYGRAPEGDKLLREIRARFPELPGPEPGALLVFSISRRDVAQHIGLLTFNETIVHANAAAGVVCEQAYDRQWQERTLAAFDLTRRAG